MTADLCAKPLNEDRFNKSIINILLRIKVRRGVLKISKFYLFKIGNIVFFVNTDFYIMIYSNEDKII